MGSKEGEISGKNALRYPFGTNIEKITPPTHTPTLEIPDASVVEAPIPKIAPEKLDDIPTVEVEKNLKNIITVICAVHGEIADIQIVKPNKSNKHLSTVRQTQQAITESHAQTGCSAQTWGVTRDTYVKNEHEVGIFIEQTPPKAKLFIARKTKVRRKHKP